MSRASRALAGSIAATLVAIVLSGHTLFAQSPTVLLFYGEPLKQQITLTDADAAAFTNLWTESSIKVEDLGNRPYRQVAIFWNSRSNPANNGTPVEKLTPAMAWQHGRLYLPTANKPAVLLTTRLTKAAQPVPVPSNASAFVLGGTISDAALAVLKQKGVVPR
jgi:hypothetical protein